MQNPRQTIWCCLAVLSLSLAFVVSLVAVGPSPFGTTPAAAQSQATEGGADSAPVKVPDIALIVSGTDPEQNSELLAPLVTRLESIDGVQRATVDVVGEQETVYYLVRSDAGGARSVDAVAAEAVRAIQVASPQSTVLVGGSALADKALLARFGTTATVVVVVGALIGLCLGLVFGLKRGLLSAATLAITVACGASIGTQAGGRFDGTLAATPVPGALTALLVSAIVAIRLLVWFRDPLGSDGAEMIRNAVNHLLIEFALVVAGLAFVAVLVELLDPGRSPLTVVCISALVAAVVTSAVMAPALAVLRPEPPPASGRPGAGIPVSLPDGRDMPLAILAAVSLGLLLLSIFALRQPGADLLDVGRLSDDDESALVSSKLMVAGGDATTALLVFKPDGVDAAAFERWAGTVVERPEVEIIDLASGRLTSTGPVEVSDSTLLLPRSGLDTGVADGTERAEAAVVVLNVSPRSEQGQQAVRLIEGPSLLGSSPRVEGYGAEAAGLASSRTTTVVAVIALAAAAAAAMQVLTQNRSQAAVTFVLRLLGGGATVGIYRLMAPGATMAETLTVLAVMALGSGLLHVEFAALGRSGYQLISSADEADGPPNPGQYAAFGLISLGLAGLAISVTGLFGGGPDAGRLSLGLVAVVVVELLSGALLLIPALLGQRGAFHTVVRPVRIALHSAAERTSDESAILADPTWRRIVEDLIQAEFRLQSDPAGSNLENVFVPDTPLYRQASTHHSNLSRADLRIVGRSPRLRSIKTVGGRSRVSLAITVDHPERQLVARDGSVVGVRKAERRSGVLWLSEAADGSFRIAESVELGSVPLPDDLDGDDGLGGPGLDPMPNREIRLGDSGPGDNTLDVTDELSAPNKPQR